MTTTKEDGALVPSFEKNPFKRLSMYSTSTPDGGIMIDAKTLCEDFLATMKMNGHTLEAVLDGVRELWPDVAVSVTVPQSKQN